MSQFLIL